VLLSFSFKICPICLLSRASLTRYFVLKIFMVIVYAVSYIIYFYCFFLKFSNLNLLCLKNRARGSPGANSIFCVIRPYVGYLVLGFRVKSLQTHFILYNFFLSVGPVIFKKLERMSVQVFLVEPLNRSGFKTMV
jgi:hypothetical protein